MKSKTLTGLLACRRGVSAVEAALVLTIFLGMMFGIINFGLVLWTQAGLHFAAEAAARCAAVNATQCGSTAATQTYALAQYSGQPLGTNPFTALAYVAPPAGCGYQVNANYTYSLSIPFYGNYSLPLAATACFP